MDLSRHTELAPIAEAVGAVQAAAARLKLDVFVAGALARDLWLRWGYGFDTGRATEDIDFAVQCRDWRAFDRLAEALADAGVVRPDERVLHRFRHPNGTLVDLIPFGGLERPDGRLAWPPDGNPVMRVIGFREVAATTMVFRLPGEVVLRVVPLHALVLLKLLAWEDRHVREPRRDAEDLLLLAKRYLDAGNDMRLYDELAGFADREDFDLDLARAELLGRDLADLCRGDLTALVRGLLARESDPAGDLQLALDMSRRDPEAARMVITSLFAGFSSRTATTSEAGDS